MNMFHPVPHFTHKGIETNKMLGSVSVLLIFIIIICFLSIVITDLIKGFKALFNLLPILSRRCDFNA